MRTFLCWHLGLGDALVCCGLVRCLVARGKLLTLPVQRQYMASVRDLFHDLIEENGVKLVPVDSDPYEVPGGHEVIRIGHHGENFDPEHWDESFYKQADVAIWAQRQLFKIGKQYPWTEQVYPALFVHDDERFPLPDIQGARPTRTASIFEHLPAMMNCSEFHGINSSFAILMALAGGRGPWKKVLYDVRKEPLPSTFKDGTWDIVRP